MLVSLWLVPGRFFRPEYRSERLLLLAVLNVRFAFVGIGAAALSSPTARGGRFGAPAAAAPELRADDDATSRSSSSSARSGGRRSIGQGKRARSVDAQHRKGGVV